MANASGYTVLHLDDATSDDSPFGRRHDRAGGAIGTSVAMHLLLLLSFWGLTRVTAVVQPSRQVSAFDPTPFVFRGLGASSSGDRGEGHASTPAVRAQTHPGDRIAVAAAAPTPVIPPAHVLDERPASDAPPAFVVPMDAGLIPRIGTMDGPSAPPTADQGVGTGRNIGTGRDDGPGHGPVGRAGVGDDPYGGDGVSPPHILYKTQPRYTTEAMRAKLQGVAILSGVVGADGMLRDIHVARSLDGTFGLDEEAIACVRQWRFRPGAKDGHPVPVRVSIEVAFNLR